MTVPGTSVARLPCRVIPPSLHLWTRRRPSLLRSLLCLMGRRRPMPRIWVRSVPQLVRSEVGETTPKEEAERTNVS